MTLQNKCPLILILALWTSVCFYGCAEEGYGSPEHYHLNQPLRSQLGKVMNEVSGICFSPNGTLLAVSDSKEKVFAIDTRTKKLKDYTDRILPSNSDVEDLVQVDSSVYLLRSSGEIREVPPGGKDSASVKTYPSPLNGRNDFETLYYDPSAQGLVMICKSCAHEKGEGVRTAYRFDLPSKTFDSTEFFTIDKEEIKKLLKNSNAKFDPSAAAINPVDKRLYILSSAGNMLVVSDTRGKVIEAYNLNPDDFPQAEGIAFAPNGDMYISNEGKYGKPTLLVFPYAADRKKKKSK